MIEVIECEQGSEEWHIARAGCITASMVSTIRAKVGGLTDQQAEYVNYIVNGCKPAEAARLAGYQKPPTAKVVEAVLNGEKVGDYSMAAKDYAFRLAIERISGVPLDEGYSTWAMKRGNNLEPDARFRHEEKIQMLIQHAGFVRTSCGRFGASADGLINNDGGSEYKCLVSPERIRSILIDGDLSEFADQVQMCMWLTVRQWWHFCLYCPALTMVGKDLTIIEVKRDQKYIDDMEADLTEFDKLVCEYQEKLTGKTIESIAA